MPIRRNAYPPRSVRKCYSQTFPDVKSFQSMRDDHMNHRSGSVDRRVSLTTLDEDVVLQILSELAVEDVIQLRKVRVHRLVI